MSSFLNKAQMLAMASQGSAPAVDGLPRSLLPDFGQSYDKAAAPQLVNGGQPQATPVATPPMDMQQRLQSLESSINSSGQQARQSLNEGQQENQVNAANTDNAAQSQIATTNKKADLMSPVWGDLETAARDLHQKTQEIAVKAQADTGKQMEKYQSAVQDAANTRITSWWSEAPTSAKVLGVISQILGGAANGLSGNPGAPTALDRVIAGDIQRQTLNLNQKNQNAQNQKSLLAEMYQQTGNLQAAQAAVYETAMRSTDARAKTIANRMATPEAMAAYEAFHAQVETKLAQANQGLAQNYFTQNQANLHDLMGIAGLHAQYQTAGLKAAVDDKVMKRKMQVMQAATTDAVKAIDGLLTHGKFDEDRDAQAKLIQYLNIAFTGSNRAPSQEEVKLLRDATGGLRVHVPVLGMEFQSNDKEALMRLRRDLLENQNTRMQTALFGNQTGQQINSQVTQVGE